MTKSGWWLCAVGILLLLGSCGQPRDAASGGTTNVRGQADRPANPAKAASADPTGGRSTAHSDDKANAEGETNGPNGAEAGDDSNARGESEVPADPENPADPSGAANGQDPASATVTGELYGTLVKKPSDDEAFANLNVPSAYRDYFRRSDALGGETLSFFRQADLDADGTEEAVYAAGDGEYYNSIGILRNKDGRIESLGEDLDGNGYSVCALQLVDLKGVPGQAVYLGLTNSASMAGFELVTLANGKPDILVYSASATGAGDDELEDFDNDGKYDGYTQYRWSYDVLYYKVNRTYRLENGQFEWKGTTVEIPDYPETAKDVVDQYFTLSYLKKENAPEVERRLKELCPACAKEESGKPLSDFWPGYLVQNPYLTIDDLLESDQEDGKAATLVLSAKDDEGKEHALSVQLTRQDKKWTIQGMQEEPDPSSGNG